MATNHNRSKWHICVCCVRGGVVEPMTEEEIGLVFNSLNAINGFKATTTSQMQVNL